MEQCVDFYFLLNLGSWPSTMEPTTPPKVWDGDFSSCDSNLNNKGESTQTDLLHSLRFFTHQIRTTLYLNTSNIKSNTITCSKIW